MQAQCSLSQQVFFICKSLQLTRILIFGNSGSGKSILAKKLCVAEGLAHLDLDTLAWQPGSPPERMPVVKSEAMIQSFLKLHRDWVIEGCYTDLLDLVMTQSHEIIYMNLSVDDCIANARNRPWEPHKYKSRSAQDANLPMLIDWIAQYPSREDTFSQKSHTELYAGYNGSKRMYTRNQQDD